jgi:hypothetical protein
VRHSLGEIKKIEMQGVVSKLLILLVIIIHKLRRKCIVSSFSLIFMFNNYQFQYCPLLICHFVLLLVNNIIISHANVLKNMQVPKRT